MPRLLAADAQRSDDPYIDPDLEAPVPVAAASPSRIETAPSVQRVTGTFADPLHESAFAAQLFRMAYPAHVLLLAAILAEYCWSALEEPDQRRYFVALVLLSALPALVGRVLLHRTGSRDPVRSQRIGGRVWAVVVVLGVALEMVGYITAPAAGCAGWKEPKYLLPFESLVFALVNGSHGLGFTCKFALVALLLTHCIVSMYYCHDPFFDSWFICAMGVIVIGAAAAHTAELYLRRSYAEKVRADAETMHGRAEEVVRRRQLEERMEQLQAEKERLLYDMHRRGRPLDDDDRSAICRGLQAGRCQPYRYPPSLGDTATDTDPDADPSEAGGPAPSDSLPTLPPGPPSSASSGSVASFPQTQLAAEALADMAMSAVAPQQSVRTAAHQPEVRMPIQRATPALCFSKQGLDSTKVAPAASVQQLDANGVSVQAIHPHGATQPILTSARTNAAAPTVCGRQTTTLKQKFETFVMRDFTPRHPDDLPLSQWVSYDTLYQLFHPHAPLDVWQKGPGNLKQLIIEWYQGDPTFAGLAPSAWCKPRVLATKVRGSRAKGTCYFCFEYTAGV